ncbi:MAG: polysaccharide pyruvyl transferase family protein [Bryobacteraceae bacterium]|nr:polysaccharide pyruvyl transferase family protein [Bryobacteraceae bacterium]
MCSVQERNIRRAACVARWFLAEISMHFVLIGDIGGPGTFHVGDEAMLAANIEKLRERFPDATFTIVSADPAFSAAEYHCRAIPRIGFPGSAGGADVDRLRKLDHFRAIAKAGREHPVLEALASADALILSGGGNLSSTWPEHLFERAALLEAAHTLGRPAFTIGQTIGPNFSERDRKVLAEALQHSRIVGVREYHSVGAALSLDIDPSRIIYQLDDTLSLRQTPVSPDHYGFDFASGEPWLAVTFAPICVGPNTDDALRSLAHQIELVAAQAGARVVFLPHTRGPSENTSDLLFSRQLAGYFRQTPLIVDVSRPGEARWLSGNASLVISMRYHPVVFGLASGVPCLGIYTDYYTRVKIRGALAHAELQVWSLSLNECLKGGLTAPALELWAARAQVAAQIRRRVPLWSAAEEKRWAFLANSIGSPDATVAGSLRDFTGSPDWVPVALRMDADDREWLDRQARSDAGLESLVSIIAARDAEIRSFKELVAARENEIAILQPLLLAREAELDSLRSVVEDRARELASVRDVLEARDQELQAVKPVLAAREEELASVKTVLAAREEELPSVKAVLAAREEELASVKTVLAARDEELRVLKELRDDGR